MTVANGVRFEIQLLAETHFISLLSLALRYTDLVVIIQHYGLEEGGTGLLEEQACLEKGNNISCNIHNCQFCFKYFSTFRGDPASSSTASCAAFTFLNTISEIDLL